MEVVKMYVQPGITSPPLKRQRSHSFTPKGRSSFYGRDDDSNCTYRYKYLPSPATFPLPSAGRKSLSKPSLGLRASSLSPTLERSAYCKSNIGLRRSATSVILSKYCKTKSSSDSDHNRRSFMPKSASALENVSQDLKKKREAQQSAAKDDPHKGTAPRSRWKSALSLFRLSIARSPSGVVAPACLKGDVDENDEESNDATGEASSEDVVLNLGDHLSVGEHSFSTMEEDVDRQRLLGGQPSFGGDAATIAATTDLQKQQRFERLLRRSKTEDLREISGIGCLYQCGHDKLGRPVIVFIGKWFKYGEINLDKALLYLLQVLEPVSHSDYVIIYFHTLTATDNHPALNWIRHVYDVLLYKHKKHLKAFYIVHPTLWTKIMTWWFTTFMAPQIKHKVFSITGIEYLYDTIDPDQLEIPAYITEHDMTVNGLRYYKSGS